MQEYVSRVFITKDGKDLADFKSFKEGSREVRAQVPLMHKTGFIRKTVRHTLEVEYAIPLVGKINWDGFEGGTLIVEDEGGNRTIFTGVSTLIVGEATSDSEGDNAMMQTISLGASDRKEE